MDGLAVVAEGFLREPFGITGGLCPFRPCVTVAVQRHAFDAKPDAALLELGCPVARADAPQIRKQRAIARFQVPRAGR